MPNKLYQWINTSKFWGEHVCQAKLCGRYAISPVHLNQDKGTWESDKYTVYEVLWNVMNCFFSDISGFTDKEFDCLLMPHILSLLWMIYLGESVFSSEDVHGVIV